MAMELCDASENFSISFAGSALIHHEISVVPLIRSLSALNILTQACAKISYGSDIKIDVKVHGSPRPGSFIVDLLIEYLNFAEKQGGIANTITILTGVVSLAIWAFGKAVKIVGDKGTNVRVMNIAHNTSEFVKDSVIIYNMRPTMINIINLTQVLDGDGFSSITIFGGKERQEVTITKKDYKYFKDSYELAQENNEYKMELQVTTPRINGARDNWWFSEGKCWPEFKAKVEDDKFLRDVKQGKYAFKNGTSILAIVRIVHIRKPQKYTYRSIIKVLKVYNQE